MKFTDAWFVPDSKRIQYKDENGSTRELECQQVKKLEHFNENSIVYEDEFGSVHEAYIDSWGCVAVRGVNR